MLPSIIVWVSLRIQILKKITIEKFMRMEQGIQKKLSPHCIASVLFGYPTLKSLRYFSFFSSTTQQQWDLTKGHDDKFFSSLSRLISPCEKFSDDFLFWKVIFNFAFNFHGKFFDPSNFYPLLILR